MKYRMFLMLLGLTVVVLSDAQARVAACFETTNRMRGSCNFSTQEEYLEGRAVCANLADDDDADECKAEIRTDRLDGFRECFEQATARNDVCNALEDNGPYDPDLEEIDFVSPDEAAENPNPYFPLIPGSIWVYEAEDEVITVQVTHETREIEGVEATIVNDVVSDEDGEIIEDTDDYYAQDLDGNVWYLGEIARNFEDGYLTDVEGSFVAGIDDAKAGILMFAMPVVGTTYRQEFLLGDAEDVGQVLSLTGDESVEVADCNGACLVIRDTTPLEPDADESKFFAPGIGLILELDNNTGERVELVEFELGSGD